MAKNTTIDVNRLEGLKFFEGLKADFLLRNPLLNDDGRGENRPIEDVDWKLDTLSPGNISSGGDIFMNFQPMMRRYWFPPAIQRPQNDLFGIQMLIRAHLPAPLRGRPGL